MIIPEDGSHPIIPEGVDDAKSRMFDFEGSFILNASMLGKGRHRLFSSLTLKWFRRSFIEKGKIEFFLSRYRDKHHLGLKDYLTEVQAFFHSSLCFISLFQWKYTVYHRFKFPILE